MFFNKVLQDFDMSLLACISAIEVEKWVYAFSHAKEEVIQ
jgi:hypothetical protein